MKFSLTTIVTYRSFPLSLSLSLSSRLERGKYDTWKIRRKKQEGEESIGLHCLEN